VLLMVAVIALGSLPGLVQNRAVNALYQTLRKTTRIKIGFRNAYDLSGTVPMVIGVGGGDYPNDTLVTMDSGSGLDGFTFNRAASSGYFSLAGLKENHASVGGQGIALGSQDPGHGVVDWVRKIETRQGDLSGGTN